MAKSPWRFDIYKGSDPNGYVTKYRAKYGKRVQLANQLILTNAEKFLKDGVLGNPFLEGAIVETVSEGEVLCNLTIRSDFEQLRGFYSRTPRGLKQVLLETLFVETCRLLLDSTLPLIQQKLEDNEIESIEVTIPSVPASNASIENSQQDLGFDTSSNSLLTTFADEDFEF